MAVTHGHGNPDWTRDEVLLALNLYLTSEGTVPGPSDPKVIELSAALRALPIHAEATKNDRFRNPDGVAFKLQNLRQVATGRGLGNTSAMDRAVWADFGSRPDLVLQLALRIRSEAIRDQLGLHDVAALNDDEEFVEGRVLTAWHSYRERRPEARARLLTARKAAGALVCEACNQGPKSADPELQEAGFEAHHVVPLASAEVRTTRVADLALLCATCHRLLHRAMQVRRRWVTVAELRSTLT